MIPVTASAGLLPIGSYRADLEIRDSFGQVIQVIPVDMQVVPFSGSRAEKEDKSILCSASSGRVGLLALLPMDVLNALFEIAARYYPDRILALVMPTAGGILAVMIEHEFEEKG